MALKSSYEAWPALSYEAFKPTAYLLHMLLQAIGKLKLTTPFEPQWTNVVLFLTSRGLTTGVIPYHGGVFTVDVDLITHQVICTTSWGSRDQFALALSSVAQMTQLLFNVLNKTGVKITINSKPQEVSNPIPFDQGTKLCPYDASLANAWWRILLSSYQVIQQYHAQFTGKTPPIGFMWGTFDLRDVRFNGIKVQTTGQNTSANESNRNDYELLRITARFV